MWATPAWSEPGLLPHAAGRVEWLERRLSLLERRAAAARQQRSGKQPWPANTAAAGKRKRGQPATADGGDLSRYSQYDARTPLRYGQPATAGEATRPHPAPPGLALSTLPAFQLDRLLLAYSNSLLASPQPLLIAADHTSAASPDRAAVASLSSLDAAIAAIRQQRAAEAGRARKERVLAAMLRDKSALLEQQQAMLDSERRARRQEQLRQQQQQQQQGADHLTAQLRAQGRQDEQHWAEAHREATWRSEERRDASSYWSVRAERERLERQLGAAVGQPYALYERSTSCAVDGSSTRAGAVKPELALRSASSSARADESALAAEVRHSNSPPGQPRAVMEAVAASFESAQCHDTADSSQQKQQQQQRVNTAQPSEPRLTSATESRSDSDDRDTEYAHTPARRAEPAASQPAQPRPHLSPPQQLRAASDRREANTERVERELDQPRQWKQAADRAGSGSDDEQASEEEAEAAHTEPAKPSLQQQEARVMTAPVTQLSPAAYSDEQRRGSADSSSRARSGSGGMEGSTGITSTDGTSSQPPARMPAAADHSSEPRSSDSDASAERSTATWQMSDQRVPSRGEEQAQPAPAHEVMQRTASPMQQMATRSAEIPTSAPAPAVSAALASATQRTAGPETPDGGDASQAGTSSKVHHHNAHFHTTVSRGRTPLTHCTAAHKLQDSALRPPD